MSENAFIAASALKAPAAPVAAFVAVCPIHQVRDAVLCRQRGVGRSIVKPVRPDVVEQVGRLRSSPTFDAIGVKLKVCHPSP